MFCRKCGSKLLPNSKVCSKCGTPITTGEICGGFWDLVPENTAPVRQPEDSYDRTNRIPRQQPSGNGTKKKKKGGRGALIFVSILCVVLFIMSLIQMYQIERLDDNVVLMKQMVDMNKKDLNDLKNEMDQLATKTDAIKVDTDRIAATLEETSEATTEATTERSTDTEENTTSPGEQLPGNLS